MSKISVLGVDPSLRATGLAIVSYDTSLPLDDIKSFQVSNCQVLINPIKYKGTDAILNMIDMMQEESRKKCYLDCNTVLVESPPVVFNKNWSSSIVSLLAHISGAAVAVFNVERSYLFKPGEWNKTRKKDITHRKTMEGLGDPNNWHYEKDITHEKYYEHVLDAASIAFWWIQTNYKEE